MEHRFYEMMLERSRAERLEMACDMFTTAKSLVEAGILAESPGIDGRELKRRVFLRFYEQDFEPAKLEKILAHLERVS